jgi:hypothetical protein
MLANDMMTQLSHRLVHSTTIRKSLSLLEADRLLQGKSERNHLLYPGIFFVFNFLLCAVFENSLKQDVSHAILPLFLFVEFGLYFSSSISHYQQQVLRMLQMSTVFPVSSGSLYLYSLVSDIVRPMSFVFLLTNTLFIGILYHASLFTLAVALLLFLLLFLSAEIFFAAVAMALRKSVQPGIAVMMLTVVIVGGTLVISVVFKQQSVLASLPLVSWCSNGIYAARSGESGIFFLNTVLLVFISLIGILAGLRLSKGS